MSLSAKEITQIQADLATAKRELQIEAAVERIRVRALAMRESEEILAVATDLKAEMKGLGLEGILSCQINIRQADGTYHVTEISGLNEDEQADFPASFSYDPADLHPDIHVHDVLKVESFTILHLDQKALRLAMSEAAKFDPEYAEGWEEYMDSGAASETWFAVCPQTWGQLGFDFDREPSGEAERIIKRLAGAVDLVLTRFLDLVNAEAQTREAQIGLAVERVRAKALAMHKSEDLLEVATALREEMRGLGHRAVSASTIYIDQGNGMVRVWDMSKLEDVDHPEMYFDHIMDPSEWSGDYFFQEILASTDYHVFYQGPEQLRLTEKWIRAYDPDYADELVALLDSENLENLWISAFPLERGQLTIDFLEEPPDEVKDILPKMAAAFDLAYTRFEDLQLAEAQAREAQIEFSLERVRGRTAGMRDSAEWGSVLGIAFEEMRRVGFDINMSVLVQYDTSTWDSDFWISGFGQDIAPVSYFTKRVDHPIADRFLKAFKSEEDFFHISFGGEEKRVYDELLLSQEGWVDAPQSLKDGIRSVPEVHVSSAKLGSGWIQIASVERLPEQMESLLRRFGAVIRMMNTRFQDLKEAEAAAREAKIEASLARLRGRAMSMQKPDDIGEVSILLFDELEALEMNALRSGIGFPSEDGKTYEFRAATKSEDGLTTLVVGREDIDVHPLIRECYDYREKGGSHMVRILEGDELLEYYHAVFDTMPLPDWKERMKAGSTARECFSSFAFSDGWIYSFTEDPMTEGEIELIFAFSGEEALQQLVTHGQTDVVLVLSDINMPGMTGFELLKKIKEVPPPVPVCMMTAYDNDEYRGKAADLNCDGYVSKPIDFAALKDTIHSLVD